MMGNFFNRMYYGKAGKGDYRPEDLPANRWALFWEMLRIRWSGVARANLFQLLFFIPAILWTLLNVTVLFSLAQEGVEGEAAQSLANFDIVFQYLLGMAPCIAITGPFTAGVTAILRNWARDQHSFFMSDFKDTVKANWKQALAVSAITGVLPVIALVCWRFYGGMAVNNILFMIPQMLVMVLALIWLLALALIYPLMITYELKFGALVRNAVVLSVGRLPQSVGIRLVALAPLALGFVVAWFTPWMGYTLLVLGLFYLVIGFGLNRFVYVSYANALFDRYINPRIEGAAVNQGLRQYTDEDYEVDPTMPQPGRKE
ncbi:MAG: DUF624 domain-containing protein [Oscillospiraceae bacterium]|jgi:uncharacterized membrane protein YesL|nr:DUF624 domain-containing protein [Oscillospiraceae bacterium]